MERVHQERVINRVKGRREVKDQAEELGSGNEDPIGDLDGGSLGGKHGSGPGFQGVKTRVGGEEVKTGRVDSMFLEFGGEW